LSEVGNNTIAGNKLIADILPRLTSRLPLGWQAVSVKAGSKRLGRGASAIDAILKIRGPGNATGSVLVEVKARCEPKDVDYLAATLRPTLDRPILVMAPFVSPRTQERLKTSGFGYADLTGNIRLSLSRPGLFVETIGARENPQPTFRDRTSLKGAKAGRLIRALCDFRPPLGLRDVAKRAGVDPGYASRIIDVLDREALVVRAQRGPITTVDWAGLLRRWSQDYSPFQRQRVAWYLAPRGLPSVIDKLKTLSDRYAVSGSWAATQFAPIAPPRLLLLYADNPAAVAEQLEVKPTDAGANVALVAPRDPVVYERTSQKKGVTVAAISQIAADLLTSPGRGPNEAEALIQWMGEHENAWRV
jgi:hypothetical protein